MALVDYLLEVLVTLIDRSCRCVDKGLPQSAQITKGSMDGPEWHEVMYVR